MMVNLTSKIKKPKISKDQETRKISKENQKEMHTSTTQCNLHTLDA